MANLDWLPDKTPTEETGSISHRTLPDQPDPADQELEDRSETLSWVQGRDDTLYEKVRRAFTQDSAETTARAMNAMAMSRELDIPPSMALEHHDLLTKELGLRDQPLNRDMMEALFILPITYGLATSALPTILGVAGFMALGEAESYVISQIKGKEYRVGANLGLADLTPQETSQNIKHFLDIADFFGKAYALGGLRVGALKLGEAGADIHSKAMEKFFRDIHETYELPRYVFVKPEEVRTFVGSGPEDLGPAEAEYNALQELGLSTAELKSAAKYGLDIRIPAERLVRIMDKPWWKRMKGIVRLSPYEEIRAPEVLGEVTKGVPPERQLMEPTEADLEAPGPEAAVEPEVARDEFVDQVRAEGLEGVEIGREMAVEGIEGAQTVTKEIGTALKDVERDINVYRDLLSCLQNL